ncbi:hypothetical protein GCM10009731_63490 [Streptomyces globosus]
MGVTGSGGWAAAVADSPDRAIIPAPSAGAPGPAPRRPQASPGALDRVRRPPAGPGGPRRARAPPDPVRQGPSFVEIPCRWGELAAHEGRRRGVRASVSGDAGPQRPKIDAAEEVSGRRTPMRDGRVRRVRPGPRDHASGGCGGRGGGCGHRLQTT